MSRASPMAALRRPTDHGLDGTIWDLAVDRPIVDAEITALRLDGAGGAIARSDERGHFAVRDLPDGSWRVTVAAPGYLGESFERSLPHRGELRGLRVRLQPIRARVLALYTTVAQPLLPEARLVATWTPRELLDHVRRQLAQADALSALTDLVEETYYSGRVPDLAALERAESLADQVPRPSH